jgi:hypothetical protein
MEPHPYQEGRKSRVGFSRRKKPAARPLRRVFFRLRV